MTACLFLIPSPLGNMSSCCLPEAERLRIVHITHFVVEAEKTARKYLKTLCLNTAVHQLALSPLNEHTRPENIPALLAPLHAGHDIGLISEAGCPAIADPGAHLVALAHDQGIRVVPLVGPSSILLALMASGANGQCFAFQGYLPIAAAERAKTILTLEQRSSLLNETQIFIETPYRNMALIAQLRTILAPSTRLTVACDLTLPTQNIISRQVAQWPKELPDWHKRPAIFIVYAGTKNK